MATVDIVLSVFNGAPFIQEQLRSLQAQSHGDWRLWVRDDGSTDGTGALVGEISATDGRVRLHPRDGEQRGVSGGFSWLLERIPEDCRYVSMCDADDVWLPEKLELSLEAMGRAERAETGPVLVHTDLTVTDSALKVLDPSLWHSLGIRPEPVSLRRLLVENVVTGPTLLLNRELVERVRPIPSQVPHHDWWIGLVAQVFGRIVTLSGSTVLYRRHGGNHTAGHTAGREAAPGRSKLGWMARELFAVWGRTPNLRKWIHASALQAELFLDRFREDLSPEELRLLEAYAEIPHLGFVKRKLRILRHRALPEHGLARNLALLLRA